MFCVSNCSCESCHTDQEVHYGTESKLPWTCGMIPVNTNTTCTGVCNCSRSKIAWACGLANEDIISCLLSYEDMTSRGVLWKRGEIPYCGLWQKKQQKKQIWSVVFFSPYTFAMAHQGSVQSSESETRSPNSRTHAFQPQQKCSVKTP